MQAELRTIRLGGILGKKYGRVHRFSICSPAEAMRAMCSQFPGFQEFLATSKDKGMGFVVLSGGRDLTENELQFNTGDVRIVPVLIGSKSGGLFNIILGATLIVAGFLLSAAGFPVIGAYLIHAGVAMVISGIVQLLSPSPKAGKKDKPNNIPNYSFNGAINTTAQGNPVPVLYGNLKVGSAVISAGINVTDGVYIPTTAASQGGTNTFAGALLGSFGGGGGGAGALGV